MAAKWDSRASDVKVQPSWTRPRAWPFEGAASWGVEVEASGVWDSRSCKGHMCMDIPRVTESPQDDISV